MMEMQLKKVELNADVYMTCMQHALSTENYEVMGLLIGSVSITILNVRKKNISFQYRVKIQIYFEFTSWRMELLKYQQS